MLITSRYYLRAKVIFLCRDPRDIITSNYHQVTKEQKIRLVLTINLNLFK